MNFYLVKSSFLFQVQYNLYKREFLTKCPIPQLHYHNRICCTIFNKCFYPTTNLKHPQIARLPLDSSLQSKKLPKDHLAAVGCLGFVVR